MNGMDATLTKQSHARKGTIAESVDDIDEYETDDEEHSMSPKTGEHEFIILYEDLDAEILYAKTLDFSKLRTSDIRKQVHRVAYLLEKQDSEDIRADVVTLCDTTSRPPRKKPTMQGLRSVKRTIKQSKLSSQPERRK